MRHVTVEMQNALAAIQQERLRQVTAEGYTPEHDDEHTNGELALAAACYAAFEVADEEQMDDLDGLWPFEGCVDDAVARGGEFPAPGPDLPTIELRNRVGSLVKAGALIVAEIERLMRTTR